ncbi:MAG: hypothetical protein GY737_20070 [Desulfobacteraceae bacterium]|nr:hypothetical protein [Desulfobacteraceae bacterium]
MKLDEEWSSPKAEPDNAGVEGGNTGESWSNQLQGGHNIQPSMTPAQRMKMERDREKDNAKMTAENIFHPDGGDPQCKTCKFSTLGECWGHREVRVRRGKAEEVEKEHVPVWVQRWNHCDVCRASPCREWEAKKLNVLFRKQSPVAYTPKAKRRATEEGRYPRARRNLQAEWDLFGNDAPRSELVGVDSMPPFGDESYWPENQRSPPTWLEDRAEESRMLDEERNNSWRRPPAPAYGTRQRTESPQKRKRNH